MSENALAGTRQEQAVNGNFCLLEADTNGLAVQLALLMVCVRELALAIRQRVPWCGLKQFVTSF
jgi:hypothetical protein